MYKLTPRMRQNLNKDLIAYHQLFQGGRCQAWEMEELLTRAINSDTSSKNHAVWTEKGHDDKADITVTTPAGVVYPLQVKSGKRVRNTTWKDANGLSMGKHDVINISGHRMTTIANQWNKITKFLNGKRTQFLAVPCVQTDTASGRTFEYTIGYLDPTVFGGLSQSGWFQSGKQWINYSKHGIQYKVIPSCSWQVWWAVPYSKFTWEPPIVV